MCVLLRVFLVCVYYPPRTRPRLPYTSPLCLPFVCLDVPYYRKVSNLDPMYGILFFSFYFFFFCVFQSAGRSRSLTIPQRHIIHVSAHSPPPPPQTPLPSTPVSCPPGYAQPLTLTASQQSSVFFFFCCHFLVPYSSRFPFLCLWMQIRTVGSRR